MSLDARRLRLELKGVYSVVPTPFFDDGSLDLESLQRVIDLYIEAGVDGMTLLGVTGEVARLTEPERIQVLETTVDQTRGRARVIAGTSADGLRTCIEYTRAAKAIGADAVMISPPRMQKLNSDAVRAHFSAVSSAVDIEIVVQDFPPISGFTMEAELLARISREIPRARTIKLEDPPTPLKTAQILERSQGVPVNILGGLGGVFLLEELIAGTAGVMTGFAFPHILVHVVRAFQAGDIDGAAEKFYRSVPLIRFEFQEGVGMAIRKEILRRRGVLTSAALRAPSGKLNAPTIAALDRLLTWSGLANEADKGLQPLQAATNHRAPVTAS